MPEISARRAGGSLYEPKIVGDKLKTVLTMCDVKEQECSRNPECTKHACCLAFATALKGESIHTSTLSAVSDLSVASVALHSARNGYRQCLGRHQSACLRMDAPIPESGMFSRPVALRLM